MSLLLALTAGGAGNTTTPTVTASITWAALPSAPIVGVRVATPTATYTWAASASAPRVGVVAPSITAAFTLAASSSAPRVGVRLPTLSAAWQWSAAALAPVVQQLQLPESSGNYGPIGLGPVAPRRHARFAWRARAARPQVAVPCEPTRAPARTAGFAWRSADVRPRMSGLQRSTPLARLIQSSTTGRSQLVRETAATTLKRGR